MGKTCPLLSRYHIGMNNPAEGDSSSDWQKRVCLNCPVSDCVLSMPGPAREDDLRLLAVASLNPFRSAIMPTLSFWR